MHNLHLFFFSFFSIFTIFLKPSLSIDLTFKTFNYSSFLLRGSATPNRDGSLSLTQPAANSSSGEALYHSPIPSKWQETSSIPVQFRTNFTFSATKPAGGGGGGGLAFIFAPSLSSGDPRNHTFAVKFGDHVGLYVNARPCAAARVAGYWVDDVSFKRVRLGDGERYRAWIEYTWMKRHVAVRIAPVGLGRRPEKALIDVYVDLGKVFHREMYAGFSAAGGGSGGEHRVWDWSFHNTIILFTKGG